MLVLPLIHGSCAFFRPHLTPVSATPSLPASQFTVCTSRFTRLRKHTNQNFTGLSRSVLAFSRDFLGNCFYVFPVLPKTRATHKQILPSPIPGTIPKSCLCLLVICPSIQMRPDAGAKAVKQTQRTQRSQKQN